MNKEDLKVLVNKELDNNIKKMNDLLVDIADLGNSLDNQVNNLGRKLGTNEEWFLLVDIDNLRTTINRLYDLFDKENNLKDKIEG